MESAIRLVQRYGKSLGSGSSGMPVLLVLFDEQGNVVPTEGVAAEFPGPRTAGGLVTFKPIPGQGHYAHLQSGGERMGAAIGGREETWRVVGPDWRCEVVIFHPAGGEPRYSVESSGLSPDGVKFLSQF